MSKEETSSGLLSKVVKFVRNPATNWSDLDNKEAVRRALERKVSQPEREKCVEAGDDVGYDALDHHRLFGVLIVMEHDARCIRASRGVQTFGEAS